MDSRFLEKPSSFIVYVLLYVVSIDKVQFSIERKVREYLTFPHSVRDMADVPCVQCEGGVFVLRFLQPNAWGFDDATVDIEDSDSLNPLDGLNEGISLPICVAYCVFLRIIFDRFYDRPESGAHNSFIY